MDIATDKMGPCPVCLGVIKPCLCDLKIEYDRMKSEFNQIKAELRKMADEMREEVRDINNIRGGWTDATRRVSYWADQLEQPLRKEGE